MKDYAVGIDLGGTNIKGGLVRADGSVTVRKSIKTEAGGGPDHVVARMAGLAEALIAESGVAADDVAAVCVGSPGPLDSKTGIVHDAPNLAWRNVPLAGLLAAKLSVPVFVENDANAAAYGETWAGAGRGARCCIMLTLGTGIGGGIVMGGELWRGVNDAGAELGHATIKYDGRPCNCGMNGCIEAYASASAVAQRMKEAVEAGGESSLGTDILAGKDVDAEAIHQAAEAGDALSREIIEETGRLLGIAITNTVHIFNPDMVILHGGLVNAGEMLFEPLIAKVKELCFEASLKDLRILTSALGGDAGIVGAAGLAFARAEPKSSDRVSMTGLTGVD